MSSVTKLKTERAVAKSKVTRLINILDPLLNKKGSDASDVQERVSDHSTKLEDALVSFKRSHKKFSESLENETDEGQIDAVAEANNNYLTEVENAAYETLGKLKKFRAEVEVFCKKKELEDKVLPGLKTALKKSVTGFQREFEQIKSVLCEFESKSTKQVMEIPSLEFLDITGAKLALKSAFNDLDAAYDKYSETLESLELDIDDAIAAMYPGDGGFNMLDSAKKVREWTIQADLVIGLQKKKLTAEELKLNKPQTVTQGPGDTGIIKLGKAEATLFSGEARDFATFKREFSQIVILGRASHDVGYRLKQSIPEKHRHLLDSYDLSDHKGMMDELESHFGTMRLVVLSVIAELNKLKQPQDDKSFVEFVEKIEKAERDLKAVDHIDQMANEVVISKLEEKLPEKVSEDWLDIVVKQELENKSSEIKYQALIEHIVFCKGKAKYQVSKAELTQNKAKTCLVTGTTLAASTAIVLAEEEKANKPGKMDSKLSPCLVCSKDGDRSEATRHPMAKCEVWQKLPYREKIKLVSCLKCPFGNKDNHKTADCQKEVACRNCKSFDKHHPFLCDKSSPSSSRATSLSTNSSPEVILKAMIVKGQNDEDIAILEDNCSTDNYVSTPATERLNLKPSRSVVLQIEGINSVKQIDSNVFHVPIRRRDNRLEYIECYSLPRITEQCTPLDAAMYSNICKELEVDSGEVQRPKIIDILLSSRSNHLMSDEVLSSSSGLKLYSGPLGKTISGNTEMFTSEHVKSYPARVTPVICSSVKMSFSKLTDRQILDHFKEESLDSTCDKCPPELRQMTLKEEKEYQKFKDNMYLDVEGTEDDPGPYWRTSYPWLIPKTDLEDNYDAVHGVMMSTTRKLNKTPEWRGIYEGQLKDLVSRGFAKEVSSQEISDWKQNGGKSYWISHLMALNPSSKSTPIRTCFNSSQVYKGHSLNSSWMLGPDMTGDLCGILMRFREDVVGAAGDVAKMYYNVRVELEEQYMQLFMWRFEGEEQIRYFRMTRLVMGNKPSANCSQIALRESSYINNNEEKFPDAAQALVHDSYVDNTFVTGPNHNKVETKIEHVETVAGDGGFSYKPWIISGTDSPDLMIVNGETEDEKALGVMWKVKEDRFYVKVNISGKKRNVNISLNDILVEPSLKLTLRDALSLHAKAFDPLGLILPTKTVGMLLFRETIQHLSQKLKNSSDKSSSKLPWDKEIDGSLKERWLEYFSMLESLQDVTFPRSIKPESTDPESPPILITLSDGSETAYGSVAYVLWTLKDGSKEARLIMSKSKLAPLLAKGEVVKNELSGATFAVRLKTWIMKNTNLKYSEFIPFLDSRIVQDMIKKESYLLNTFAGNRVKEIASKSNVYEWNHVSSKDNWCADILTRGATPDKLKPGSDWQCGPPWLRESRDKWPVTEVDLTKSDRDTLKSFEKVSKSFKNKVKPLNDQSIGELHHGPDSEDQGELHGPLQVTLSAKSTGELHNGPSREDKDILDDLITHSSSLDKTVNATAFVLRLGGRVGKKIPEKYKQLDLKDKYDHNPITAAEHEIALLHLIEHEQKKLDMKKFSGFNLETKEVSVSPSKKLKLVILRSRVKNFPIKFQSEDDFVYVLPAGDLAKRIVSKFHKKYHKDIDTICTHVRREFWIPSLRRIAAQIDKNCKFCLILRKKVVSQLMGDLPEFRSLPSKPFETVHLDLFGPIVIKDSVVKRGARVKKKVWGSLSVCGGTRAISLDFCDDYGTESILHVIRRLKADKGNIKRIISDPGTQLKGASRELREVREGWSEAELVRFGAKNGITWDFVMASSQHQNGSAEIMIKLCKGVMKALMSAIGTNVLFINELLTVLKETANLVNERPIGLKPIKGTDPQYLSPNSLLLGRCSDRISSGPFQSKNSFQADPDSDRTRFLLVQKITTQFWKNWTNLFFPTLLRRQKWHQEDRNVKIGDVCVVKDSNAFRGEWRMSRVVDTFPDDHQRVRNVKLVSPPPGLNGSREYKGVALAELDRHVKNVVVIVPKEEGEGDEGDHGIGGSVELSQPAPNRISGSASLAQSVQN